MNRTIKDATVKRYHYDDHDQLRRHLADFLAAYNFARRLKTLKGLTPFEFVSKCWTSEPDRFKLNPLHQMPGLNTILPPVLLPPQQRTGSERARSSPSGQNGLMHRNRMSLIRLRVDHVISADEKRRWNRYTNRLSSLQVDKKLKFRGLLNRQIGGVCSFEDPVDVRARASI